MCLVWRISVAGLCRVLQGEYCRLGYSHSQLTIRKHKKTAPDDGPERLHFSIIAGLVAGTPQDDVTASFAFHWNHVGVNFTRLQLRGFDGN